MADGSSSITIPRLRPQPPGRVKRDEELNLVQFFAIRKIEPGSIRDGAGARPARSFTIVMKHPALDRLEDRKGGEDEQRHHHRQ